MDTNQKLKLSQLSLHYVLSRPRSKQTTERPYKDMPLFVEVFKRKDGEQEAEKWQDNFKVTSLKKNCINLSIISSIKIK